MGQTLLFQPIKRPIRADTDNIILFLKALVHILTIGHKTPLIGRNSPETEPRQLNRRESQLIPSICRLLNPIVVGSSGISEGVVVRRPVLVEVDGVGVGLDMSEIDTSGKYQREPCLAPTAILSLVDTCCTANGFIEETARLMESTKGNAISTGVWGETSLLVVDVRVERFVDLD